MSYVKQVDKSHYDSGYFHNERWMSYWYQAKEISSRKDIESVLDIGPGTNFLESVLKIQRPAITYKTLDIAEDVEPDYVGSVTKSPLPDSSFDAVCAFQVLEHIEFKDFEVALDELKRTSKKYVFISLPHFGSAIKFQIKVPFIKAIQFAIKIPRNKKHIFTGEHYWEIGKKGYSAKKILSILKNHFTVLEEYIPYENQSHHFFIMKKKDIKH
jgi:ubiquinone/menaquinone biosynthesis C-methylase UbiE